MYQNPVKNTVYVPHMCFWQKYNATKASKPIKSKSDQSESAKQLENVFQQELPNSTLGQGQPGLPKFSIIQKIYTGQVSQTQWRVWNCFCFEQSYSILKSFVTITVEKLN